MADARTGARGDPPEPPTVGFVGLGIMGRPMAHNLLRAGRRLVVHSRSPEPVDELTAAGAEPRESAGDVARDVDLLITMLPDTPDVETVTLGPGGVVEGAHADLLMIDMSTIDPIATRRLAGTLGEREVAFVDAPVSGGERGAIEGTLSIMVGGRAADVERAMPLFEVLGSTITHVGGIGAGQVAKAANQLVVGLTIEAVAEALRLAEAAGVDPARVREALLGGFAASRILEVHGQRMLDGAFDPGFRARLHLKDARIIDRLANELGLRGLAFNRVLDRLTQLATTDRGDLDHAALYLVAGSVPGSDPGSDARSDRPTAPPPSEASKA